MSTPQKRVIFIHQNGLWQIVGMSGPPYPSLYSFTSHGATRPGSLIRVKPRYVVYREITTPATGRFDEFHPQQQ